MATEKGRASHKRTQTERAYNLIKRGILRGEIPEGEFLSEAKVRKRYGIGRTPFREACNRLHHEQILEVVPRRGYLVPEISFRSVRDLFETRSSLESVIAELAAIRANAKQVEELDRLANRTWPAGNSNRTPEQLIKANTEFHLCLARMTQNQELVQLITGILERTERLSYLELQSSRVLKPVFRALHKPIVRAIRRRNPSAARRAVVNDIAQGQVGIFGMYGGNEQARASEGRLRTRKVKS